MFQVNRVVGLVVTPAAVIKGVDNAVGSLVQTVFYFVFCLVKTVAERVVVT